MAFSSSKHKEKKGNITSPNFLYFLIKKATQKDIVLQLPFRTYFNYLIVHYILLQAADVYNTA